MPSKKKKYNARFPAGRIKKIMQTDEEIGKVAQAVPIIISRTLELFVESLLKRAMQITSAKNAKTLTPTHMKQCILSESRFDFLKDLVKGIPDVSSTEDDFGTPCGNFSPGTPLSAKGYSCFQFHQLTDSGSSRVTNATSQPPTPQTSFPKFYKEVPIAVDDCENKVCEDSSSTPSIICGTTVIQHTVSHISNNCPSLPLNCTEGNHSLLKTLSGRNITQLNELKLSNCINMSDNSKSSSEKVIVEEDEEVTQDLELKENGYHKEKEKNLAKTCAIDDDYDT